MRLFGRRKRTKKIKYCVFRINTNTNEKEYVHKLSVLPNEIYHTKSKRYSKAFSRETALNFLAQCRTSAENHYMEFY